MKSSNPTQTKPLGLIASSKPTCFSWLIHRLEMSKKMKNCKVYVRRFPGAKVQCMDDYKKPSIRDKPDHFVIHVETNDLNSEVSPKSIAESIVDLAMPLKTESNDVSVSNIILRTDNSFKPKRM